MPRYVRLGLPRFFDYISRTKGRKEEWALGHLTKIRPLPLATLPQNFIASIDRAPFEMYLRILESFSPLGEKGFAAERQAHPILDQPR